MLQGEFDSFYDRVIAYKEEFDEARKITKANTKKRTKRYAFATFIIIIIPLLISMIIGILLLLVNKEFMLKNGESILMLLFFGLIILFAHIYMKYYFKKSDIETTKVGTTYEEIFTSKIMKPMIRLINPSFQYQEFGEISHIIFNKIEPYKYQSYLSRNLIIGNLKNKDEFQLAKITAGRTDRNHWSWLYKEESPYDYTEIFNGILLDIKLCQTINHNIYVRSNCSPTYHSKFKEKKIKNDNKAFNKVFSIYSSDEELTRRIFNDDAIQKLLEYYQEFETDYEITIKNNHIYINISCGDIFEPVPYDYKKDLYYCWNILNFAHDLSNMLVDLVDK